MSSLPFQQHMKNDQSRESFEIFFLYCSFMFDRCNADRSVHDKSWNKLAEILMSTTNEEKTDTSKENTVYVVDLIVLIPLVTAILKTFLHLVLKLITALPKGYQQFALVTDFSEKTRKSKDRFHKKDNHNLTKIRSAKRFLRVFCPIEKTRPA